MLSAEEAAEGFHARFSARAKVYRYRISNTPVLSPFERRFAWHISRTLDLDGMREAAAELVGEHDFACFQAAGGKALNDAACGRVDTARVDRSSRLTGGGRLLTYEIAGTGFLKYMVRNIIGTLVEVGDGRGRPASIRELLASGDRAAAGPTAPPHGLYLVRVDYDAAGPVSFS